MTSKHVSTGLITMMSNVISFQVSLMLNLVQLKEIEMQFFTHWIFSSSPKGTTVYCFKTLVMHSGHMGYFWLLWAVLF